MAFFPFIRHVQMCVTDSCLHILRSHVQLPLEVLHQKTYVCFSVCGWQLQCNSSEHDTGTNEQPSLHHGMITEEVCFYFLFY